MTAPRVLVVEDDEPTLSLLQLGLGDDFHLFLARDRTTALSLTEKEHPEVILLDLGLPPRPDDPEEGLRLLEDLRSDGVLTRVLVCTGRAEREHVLSALTHGAWDVLEKPVDLASLRVLVRRGCWLTRMERELDGGDAPPVPAGEPDEEMVGTSPAMRQVFTFIRKVATSDVPVLITGESGTGKELAARAIHERSARASGPFVTINCGAIPETLLEAELFGHERGAFTGAVQMRRGKVEFAQGGTLFLDEVGELPLGLQVKLLRFLQDRTIERVGGRQKITVDARIIAATNVDLARATAEGAFREDLYYRLSVVAITLPPLRERGEDAVLIARVFLKRVAAEMRKTVRGFTREALRAIQAYPWPGNVRELSNKVRRAVTMAETAYITPEDLDLPVPGDEAPRRPTSLRQARERLEADLLRQSLGRHEGNLTRVAAELGVSRPTLYALLKKHGIGPRGRRAGAVKSP